MKLRITHRFISSFTAAFSVALFTQIATPSAFATTYYWDSNDVTAGFGNATGTWGTDPFWSTVAAGTGAAANTATTTADTVNFGTTLNYANAAVGVLAGGVSVNKINFGTGQTTALTLSGGAISLGGSAPAITVNSTGHAISSTIALGANSTVSFSRDSATAGAFSLNGQISGGFNLTFTTPNVNSGGTNQIVTLGAANTYTGTTTITTGSLNNTTIIKAGVANALPTTTVLTLNGGNGTGSGRTVSYDLNSKNQTLGGLSSTTGLTSRNQQIINTGSATTTLTISNTSPASSTFGGDITGTNLRLTKSGTGTQTLSETSANTHTGITTVSGGKLMGVVGGSCVNSKVIISDALATLGVSITDNTKTWTCKDLAPTAAGTLEFNFGAVLPSSAVKPLTITGLADFTAATPPVSVVVSTGLNPGTYPLMTWGSTSGTAPTTAGLTVSSIAAGTAASLEVVGNTLNLVIASTTPTVVKANNTTNLNDGNSWVGAVAPVATDLAKWTSAVNSANTTNLGADVTWAGITIENPNGLVTINGTNTLTLGAAAIDIDLSTATADLNLNCPLALSAANNWDVAASRTLTLGGQVTGPFGVIKLGGGTTILSSATNSYTGNTTVSAGTLKLGASDVIPNGTAIGNVSVAGTLDLNGKSETVNGLSGAGTIDNLAAATTSTLTVGDNDQTTTFSGVIQNTAGILNLTKTGTGELTLSAANTFSGTTTVTGGTLIVGNGSALSGTTGIALAGGTMLTPNLSAININKPITLGATGTTATITAPDVAGSGTTNFPVTLSGGISGDGNVTFSGVSATNAYGVVNLNAANTYAGSTLITTISAYAGGAPNNANIFMNLGVANALPVTTVVTLDGGDGGGSSPGRYCELDLNGKNQTLAGLTNVTGRTLRVQRVVNNSTTAATLTVNNSVDHTYSGQLGWVSGYGSTAYNNLGITKSGIGIFTVSGSRTYSGNTTVNGGTLRLGSINTNNELSTVTIAASAATLDLAYTGTDTVEKLFIGSTQLIAGVYGPSATNIPQITGTGTLTVTSGPPTGGYSGWKTANSTTQTIDLDHDGDGVSNGIEYFLFGSANTTGFTPLPGITNTSGTLGVTWTKAAGYTGTYNTDFVVETSSTLTGVWTAETLGVNVTVTGSDVKYTFPAGTRNFARLRVTGP